ncbi:MAG: hypothetical protein AAFY43_10090 [Pseudomonadota bacterium]
MKRAHRSAHRFIWLLLPPAIAVILWLALTERPDEPVNATLPYALSEEAE